MNDQSKAQAVAGGALVSALIDVLLDKGILTKADGKTLIGKADLYASLAVGSEPFAKELADFLSNVRSSIARRKD